MKKSTKRKIKRKFGEITIDLLEFIARIPTGVVNSFLDQRSLYYSIPKDDSILDNFFNHIRNLHSRGYIEIQKDGKNTSIRLTNKGKIKKLESMKTRIPDGKWRILSFDIPQKMKKIRDQFRRSIKRLGFKQVQQSLWVSPFINADEIDLIIDELKIRQFVAYFVIDKSDIQEHLELMFDNEFKK